MLHHGNLVSILAAVAFALPATGLLAESNTVKRLSKGRELPSERDEQQAAFEHCFQNRQLVYETEFARLKTAATVANWRIPYSTPIYPEHSGGLSAARSFSEPVLSRYDRAFHAGRDLAYLYDRRRKMRTGTRHVGLFGRPQSYTYYAAESWEGYCSGFTASTIMHPEPMRPVDAGTCGGQTGVVFQPSDIKALLCAVYNRTRPDSYLMVAPPSARDGGPNMGTFHLTLANYIGQAGHPVGIDRTKGQVTWNNPIYEYQVTSIRDAGRYGEVQYKDLTTKITYTWYGTNPTNQTHPENGERTGQLSRSMSIRYYLELDTEGKIVGGRALSPAGHFLWIPLYPVQAIADQSSPGNPHLDVPTVLALARASALPNVQEKYDQVAIGNLVDPQIAARAEAERQRRLAAQAERERQELARLEHAANPPALAQAERTEQP